LYPGIPNATLIPVYRHLSLEQTFITPPEYARNGKTQFQCRRYRRRSPLDGRTVLRDKTEFINRVIAIHGRATVEAIMRERQDALHDALREHETTYKSTKDTAHIKRTKTETA